MANYESDTEQTFYSRYVCMAASLAIEGSAAMGMATCSRPLHTGADHAEDTRTAAEIMGEAPDAVAILPRLRMHVACGFNRTAPQVPQHRCP